MRHITCTPFDQALLTAEYSGKRLAWELGVNESQVSRWRRGVNIPTQLTRQAIAKLLGVSAAALWPEEEA